MRHYGMAQRVRLEYRPLVNRLLILVLPLAALAGCNRGDPLAGPQAERDPAAAAALNDPIMADPDLASQNRGNSALSGGGPAQGDLPAFSRTAEEATAARTAAAALLGGKLIAAPPPASTGTASRLAGALTLPVLLTASGIGSPACAAALSFTMGWAARLPTAVPIYPRGHVIMAAGSNASACQVRALRYVTPVEPGEVADFAFASAAAGKLAPVHRREGADVVISGGTGAQQFAVYARKRADGLSEVDLFTSGW